MSRTLLYAPLRSVAAGTFLPAGRLNPGERVTRCACGLDRFWDEDERRLLCPARFDGEHHPRARR